MYAEPVCVYTLIVLELLTLVLVVACKLNRMRDQRRFIKDVNNLEGNTWLFESLA